jgi:hypothetical protein
VDHFVAKINSDRQPWVRFALTGKEKMRKEKEMFVQIPAPFLKRCPKTGRIRGINIDNRLMRFLFPLTGLVAMAWFSLRVLPKPSRVGYPCMQTAVPMIQQFLALIAGIGGSIFAFFKARCD